MLANRDRSYTLLGGSGRKTTPSSIVRAVPPVLLPGAALSTAQTIKGFASIMPETGPLAHDVFEFGGIAGGSQTVFQQRIGYRAWTCHKNPPLLHFRYCQVVVRTRSRYQISAANGRIKCNAQTIKLLPFSPKTKRKKKRRPDIGCALVYSGDTQALAQEAVSKVLEGRRYSHAKVSTPS